MRNILSVICKKALLIFSVFVLFLGGLSVVNAQQPASSSVPAIPEKNGDYPDPTHPGVRVRVFVHEPKARTTSNETLACTDSDSAAVVHAAGWKLPAGNWTYNLNVASVPSSVGSANLTTIASNGFGAWSSAVSSSSSKPIFVRGSDTAVNRSAYDGQNVIAWGRTSGTALATTYIRYYTSSGLVVDVDTIMNKKFPWSWTDPSSNVCSLYPNAYDAQDILIHEQGHWMGLDDEYGSSYVNNTLYGYGAKGEVKKNTLTSGDIQGVQAIYP